MSSPAVPLNPEDTLVLKEQLEGGYWKAELNGRAVKLQILDVRSASSPLSVSEPGSKRVKPLNRQKSGSGSKDSSTTSVIESAASSSASVGSSTTAAALPPPLPSDSILLTSPRGGNMVSSASAPSLNIQAIVSNPNLNNGTPRKGAGVPTTPKSEQSSGLAPPPPQPETPNSAISDEQRNSFRKRASLLLQGVSDATINAAKGAANLVRRRSKKNLDDPEDMDPSIPPPPPFPEGLLDTKDDEDPKKRRKAKKTPSSKQKRTEDIKRAVAMDIDSLRADLEMMRIEAEIAVKAFQEQTGTKMSDPKMLLVPSAEERMLEKMIEAPYQSLFKLNNKPVEASIALAPTRPLMYKTLFMPVFNVNSLSAEEKQLLTTLDFDVLPFKDRGDEEHVYLLLMNMFHDLGLIETFKIPEANLYRFLVLVARRYRDVPFHNFFHAFNVTQTMYFFLKTCQASNILAPLEIMAMLIATICHDCDHPGLNNDFQRKAQTRIAHLHKKSILENHHYLQCMAALSKPETNILLNLTQEQEDQIYTHLRDLILATDLAVHGIILKNLTERKKQLHRIWRSGSPQGLTDEDKKLIMCSMVKCSDLSNEIRKQNISRRWAKMVLEEFFAQSDKERELELPVTPFMDKHKIIIAKEQINFIEKLCMPLYTQISAVFTPLEACVRQLEENRDAWNIRLRLFFSEDSEEFKRLSNRSIWEREQVKAKTNNLSATLAERASGSGTVPKAHRRVTLSSQSNSSSSSEKKP